MDSGIAWWANGIRGSIQLAKYARVISAGSGVKGQRKSATEEHSGQLKPKVGKVSLRGEEKKGRGCAANFGTIENQKGLGPRYQRRKRMFEVSQDWL